MMGYCYGPATLPPQASAWWSAPSGPTALTAWQPPNEGHWWGQPQPNAIAWARPAASTPHWSEPPVQWVHPGTGCPHPVHPLALMAYACPQHHPQQQVHGLQAQQPTAQHKEQDTVLKSIEHATDRIAQLETAIKAQEQRQKQQEEAIQGSVTMQQYVSQQMEDWRTWKESEENSQTYKVKHEAVRPSPQQSVHGEHRTKQQEVGIEPMRPRSDLQPEASVHPDFEVKPLIKQILTGMEALLKGQEAGGTKRRRSPSTNDLPPPKRTTHSEKAFIPDKQNQKPISSNSKQTKPFSRRSTRHSQASRFGNRHPVSLTQSGDDSP